MAVEGMSPDGLKLIGWTALPVPLATLVVALRFYVRYTTQNVKADDWCCLLSLALYCAQYACFAVQAIHGGVGWSQADLSSQQLEILLKSFWCAQLLYGFLSPTIKVSFLLFYRRVLSTRGLNLATLIVGTLSVAWGVAVVFTVIFECLPVSSYWHPDQRTKCINDRKFQQATGIVNTLLDITVLLLPIPTLRRLYITISKTLALSLTIALGAIVVVFSALRVHTLFKTPTTTAPPHLAIWTGLETGLAIICSSLPTSLVLFRQVKEDAERKWWGGAGRREVMGWTFERRERVNSGLDLTLGEKGPGGETLEVGSEVDIRNMPIREGITVRYEYSVSRV